MVHIYFDAATNQTSGENGIGVWIKSSDGKVSTYKHQMQGLSTVHAELAACAYALEQAHKIQGETSFMLYSDAEVIVRALEQRFMKDASAKPLFLRALIAYDDLPNVFLKWIPRAENRADVIAREALNGTK
ncbi:reverse transcriptase-like protein [Exiguobacterium aestuarii]|uniref:Reverse transcriptase-like protein n=1 Tax=Exiguobacterium aestuarii TaxID=273527 RepID=A0ABW2PQS9_9BACL|nr:MULTISPECIES: reverse transcriptase-like protein [Exiguobacterium]MCT4784930.1 reverse transcriptase-like protein [Exiguobacterium aestuarii]